MLGSISSGLQNTMLAYGFHTGTAITHNSGRPHLQPAGIESRMLAVRTNVAVTNVAVLAVVLSTWPLLL